MSELGPDHPFVRAITEERRRLKEYADLCRTRREESMTEELNCSGCGGRVHIDTGFLTKLMVDPRPERRIFWACGACGQEDTIILGEDGSSRWESDDHHP